ncbi:probable E3 ubiquitin-protein ligase BAH1-like isoform X2 [Arachis ipaensis]|uniref:probable E3 ubiquitin-protein ligase BAH1-like isoform X2 n=1 Tax=Arachis ipaensis TaxID=130454 RepID=UPI000A2B1935|nr:probable E3 ubiquitin-protein ligase BAH1-like isoform X2 [Arachis ipaensis]
MKFGCLFTEYLQEERELLDEKCAHIEYVRLKKVLKSCQTCKPLHSSSSSSSPSLVSDLPNHQLCQCQSCPVCDQKFFSELMKEASDIVGFFGSRVKHLLDLHVASGMQRYVLRLRQCFKNDSGRDCCELNGVYGHFKCDLNVSDAVMTLILPDSIKLEYNLTCAICLDLVFNPYALGCGHIFCKSCACSAASVMMFQGLKAASPESKCPICREDGVYPKKVRMLELGLLMKRRYNDYWKERLLSERNNMVKQSKEYWNMQSAYALGLH